MTLAEIREQVMFQTGSENDDLGEVLPHLNDYINEGYGRLTQALYHQALSVEGDYPPLRSDRSTPQLPGHLHRALADYATWMICRNGSAPRQSRGAVFLRAFEHAASLAQAQNSGARFTHIPV